MMYTRQRILATLESPMASFDATVVSDSNYLTFNRQKQLVRIEGKKTQKYDTEKLQNIAESFGIDQTTSEILNDITPSQFIAVAITRLFIKAFSRGDGMGLMSGVGRYNMLLGRMIAASFQSESILDYWNALCKSMLTGVQQSKFDADFLKIAGAAANPSAVMDAIRTQPEIVLTIARHWAQNTKSDEGLFAQERKLDFAPEPESADGMRIAEVPAYSGNALRHVTVRRPGYLNAMNYLGIPSGLPQDNESGILPAVEALFANGGNLEKKDNGSNQFHDGTIIKNNYPILNLLGGCTNNWDLGESKLKPSIHLICRENRNILDESLLELDNASISAFDMLDGITQTRTAHKGVGQMIYNFETLAKGSQFVINFTIHHDVNNEKLTNLTLGSFYDALQSWAENPSLGGKASEGFGQCNMQWVNPAANVYDLSQAYRDYMTSNKDDLAAWLRDGTLGTGKKVIS